MPTTRRFRLTLLLSLLVAALSISGFAQQAGPPAATAPLTARIPIDPQITTGQLPNGLRYYIRANKQPQDRLQLHLVVNAGSVLEDDDQRGLAHFVEHMAFNGTKHFPGAGIIDFMQSIGMRFGADLNAYTSFDETVFMLDVPTDKPEVLDKAMLVLEDWAHNLTFDDKEIDKERGVVIEEWRLGRGASAREQDKTFPVLLKGSRYADRLPIGKVDVLQHFKHDRLRKFYADWYRPDLMAVVAVGDVDPAAMQKLIVSHMGPIPAARNPRPRPHYDVPGHPGTLYAIATDKEETRTSVAVYNTMPARDQSTIAAYRQQEVLESLYSGALSARLAEMARKPEAPFLGAAVERGPLVRTADASILTASVKDGGVDAGLDALFTESARVARFGFTQTELDRQKTNILRNLEAAVTRKDERDSDSLAAEYTRNFLTGEPIPGIVYESDLFKRFLPDIKVDELNALAQSWSPDRDRVVIVTAPDKPGTPVPTEAALAADMAAAANKTLTAYVDVVKSVPLIASMPTPGSVVATSSKPEYGITEWTLSNGAKVVLKPTTFKADEVLLDAYAFGGTSLASDQDYIAASTAAQVVSAGGLGELSADDLRKLLAGKAASVRPFIGETDEGVSGSASPKDLETLFQLAYLTFTQPRKDPEQFAVLTDRMKVSLANQENTPQFAFSSAMNAALTQNHFRARPLTLARVNEMNLDRSFAFYRERFADASAFTFFFVGTFDPAALKPLVERYLASLPATHAHEMWKDDGIRPPKGAIDVRVAKGVEPQRQTRMVFTGTFDYDQQHRATMRAMTAILENRLREVVREDLSGTYSITVRPSYSKIPREEYEVTIAFGSAPERSEALGQRVLQEIQKLKASGPTAAEMQDTQSIFLRDLETSDRDNGFFLRELTSRSENGEDLKDLFGLADIYNGITADGVKKAANTYLDTNNCVTGRLLPEK